MLNNYSKFKYMVWYYFKKKKSILNFLTQGATTRAILTNVCNKFVKCCWNQCVWLFFFKIYLDIAYLLKTKNLLLKTL